MKAEAEGRRTSWYEQPTSTKAIQTQAVKAAKVGISIDLPQVGIVDPVIRDVLRLQEDKARIYREATAVLRDIDTIKRSLPWL